ncbi:MAG TPA: VCBS repeat-containing protein [Planctomycetota bacterium]
MDLDRDGRADLVSGSYLPGDVFWFPRAADGGLGDARRVDLASGEPLRVGRASWPFVGDWEGDGDLDLVVGNMLGAVLLVRNGSGGVALALAAPEPLRVAGAELKLVATNAAPCLADWDGDGAQDLLLGAGDGAVRLYRNASRSGEPILGAPVELIAPCPAGAPPARPTRSGPRARVAVADWNADGRLDLLVGEHVSEDGPPVTLDAAGERALEEALRASAALGLERGERERAAFTRWLAEKRIPPGEASAHHDDFLVEWEAGAEGRALVERQAELTATLARLQAPVLEHGRVWVYLRRAP